MAVKGHRVALGGSYSGDTGKLFKSLNHDDIFQFSLVGREVSIQVKSEKLDETLKALAKLGVSNLSIQEWRKYGTTIANSGSSPDAKEIISVSLIPTTIGTGLRPLSFAPKIALERKLYVELLVDLESVLHDAGITDALYLIKIGKKAQKEQYLEAVKDATLNAIFNAGGIVGIE